MNHLIILGIFLLLIQNSYAHNHKAPVNPSAGFDDLTSPNHAGYGYAGRSSEAEADKETQFECDKKNSNQYLKECAAASNNGTQTQNMNEVVKNLEKEKTLQLFKNQVFEYQALQAAAISEKRPIELSKPICIDAPKVDFNKLSLKKNTRDVLDLLTSKISLEKNPDVKKVLKSQFDIEYKHYVVSNSTDPANVVNATALFRQLENAKKTYQCKPDGVQSLYCLDISDQMNRIKFAYPTVFSGDGSYERMRSIEDAAHMLLGAPQEGAQGGFSQESIKTRGSSIWSSRVRSTGWDSMQELKREINESLTIAREGSPEPDEFGDIKIRRNQAIDNAFVKLNEVNEKINKDLGTKIKEELSKLCEEDFQALAIKYPHVLRQMILDQPKENLSGIKLTVCGTEGVKNKLVDSLERSCEGVSGSFNSETKTVSVNRVYPSFPFASSQKYNVTKNPDGSLTVNLNVYFQQKGTPPISGDELTGKMSNYSKNVSAFFNDSISGFSPPPNPGVKFKIKVIKGTGSPNFFFSKCFNRSLPAEQQFDCKKVEEAGGSWQDSGHLTFDSDVNTINHEFSHVLGLEDEYLQDYYPMNKLGEHDSIMNSGSKLYPRHVNSIVRVATRCGK